MPESIISSPVTEELRTRAKELRLAIRSILDEWYTLQNTVRPRLLAEYDNHFREIEIEIQQKTLKSSEIGRRVELLTLKKERGEKLTPEIISLVNIFVDKEFAKFHKRIREAYSMSAEQREQAAIKENQSDTNGELPKLYRAIVKKLHPDVSTETDEFSKFWHSAQQAFENKNLQKMRSLYTLICMENEATDTRSYPDSFSETMRLEADIKELEIRLEREERKLSRMKSEAPYSLESNLKDAKWLMEHRQKLEYELHKKNAEIKQFNALMEQLTGGKWEQTSTPKTIEQENLDQEFMNSTYFSGR